jgi:protein-L-isoaspartate(D-aspartate) O-methyltransferase
VLDIGSGSGYLCAIFHHLIRDESTGVEGKTVGVEHIPELVDLAERNLRRDGRGQELDNGSIKLITGDGRLGLPLFYHSRISTDMFQGYPSEAPYDAIHVGAAAPTIPPALVEQLASPGRMFIPVGTYEQEMVQVDKDEKGVVSEKKLFGVRVSVNARLCFMSLDC